MNSSKRKIILIICEGKADMIAYETISFYLSLLHGDDRLKPIIHIMQTHGDLLTKFYNHKVVHDADFVKLISNSIKPNLTVYCHAHKVTLDDFDRIMMITDSDGVFVSDSRIEGNYNSNIDPYYDDDMICTHDRKKMIDRNNQKRKNIEYLLDYVSVPICIDRIRRTIPLYLYYVSCNLDHMMVDDRNNNEKIETSRDWANELKSTLSTEHIYSYFDQLLYSEHDYEESWKELMRPNTSNSLRRSSNIALILDYLQRVIRKNMGGERNVTL